jgi:pimeloyl-ACP methyl ester carboxylesterase
VPRLTRPDGAELAWLERGEGPLVVLAVNFWAYPALFEDLIAELEADHRVVTYDPRGNGDSSREGPFDAETDTADLAAVVEEAGGAAVVMAMGDAAPRAVRLAAERPELVAQVVCPATTPFVRQVARGSEGLAASESVLELLRQQFARDYRSALHRLIEDGNPQLDQEAIKRRIDETVERCPQDAAAARLQGWLESDVGEREANVVGERLWLLEFGGDNPWFPASVWERTRKLVPAAHFVALDDGPISRPDQTAAVVRDAVAASQPAPSR